jgi:hypothetical protein
MIELLAFALGAAVVGLAFRLPPIQIRRSSGPDWSESHPFQIHTRDVVVRMEMDATGRWFRPE